MPQTASSQMVFVNLFRPPLGRPMSYPSTKESFDRLARTAGHACRPHMLRHAAATRWLREGVDRDVVQRLRCRPARSALQPGGDLSVFGSLGRGPHRIVSAGQERVRYVLRTPHVRFTTRLLRLGG
ncbi:tyrosine-type recombinase/integrase [Streptomyces sp. NPDC014684]|uniref:tyrosine-type recombinase/integrase n=1 Tax=Streptomyces sp. NPDC014684 TaxID=3364880 RepID=UPI0037034D51